MREMKDSGIEWIGEIPTHWNVYPLKYNFDFISGATPDSTNADLWDGDILWITPADYKTKDVYVSGGSRNLSDLGYKSCSTHMLPIGTVVVSKRAPIGTVAVTVKPLCTNQGCLGLVRKDDDESEKYYYYTLSIYDDVLNLYGSGTTFNEISATAFSNIKVVNPPCHQQRIIVDFLDSKCAEIDALSADIQSEIETLEAYKRSVISEAVTKGLNSDVEMKDSEIKWVEKIPINWEVKRGKYCLKHLEKPFRPDDEVITCFRDGEVTLRSNRREEGFTISLKEIGYQGIDKGDLIVHGMDGFAGAIGISDSRGKASPVLNVLDTKHNKRYIMYYLRNMAYNGVFLALATGIRIRTCDTNWGKLRELPFILPSKDEQDSIVDFIDKRLFEVDSIIDEKRKQLEILDEYKKSLIYEYVTGKKEVI